MALHFLKFIKWFVEKEESKAHPEPPTVSTSYIGTFKPVAVLWVTAAPDLVLTDHQGTVIDRTSIIDVPFKDTLMEWSLRYSLVYPDSKEWSDFWTTYKDIL